MFEIVKRIKAVIAQRQLLLRLAFKDQLVRYRSPFLGFLWALLLPFFTMLIYGLVFSVIMKMRIEDYPFLPYLITAVFPWSYFQSSVFAATTSTTESADLIKKVMFPKEMIPISVVMANLLTFLLNLGVMLIFLLCFKIRFTCLIFLLPLVVLLHTILAIGVSLMTSSLQVRYRDLKYVVELVIITLFYLTPVFYPLSLVSNNLSQVFFRIYLLNPFVGLVNLYRISLLKGYIQTLPAEVNLFNTVGIPLICAIIFLFLGFWVFRRQEFTFADFL